jgi:hypothetical protein
MFLVYGVDFRSEADSITPYDVAHTSRFAASNRTGQNRP